MSGHGVSFREAVATWAKIGLIGFGGPAGQIALMHRIVVDEKKWIGEARFLHALNYCMLLPGPEAQQLAIYLGWLLHRISGGIVAGVLFVLPGACVLYGLSVLYAGFHHLSVVQGLFFGLKPAVLAVVIDAVLRIGKRALLHPLRKAVAVLSFLAIAVIHLPFPMIIITCGLLGWLGARFGLAAFIVDPGGDGNGALDSVLDDGKAAHVQPSALRALMVTAVCLILWFAPIALAALLFGGDDVFTRIGLFFSKMAVVTFGGAYAVLAYVAQQAVESYHWLAPGEMLDGLGLAETTPGPLLMVVQFVGFLAAYRHPQGLDPLAAGTIGALLTTWVTFVPCFLWIFLGGPYVERLRGNQTLNGALAAITSAVVGVIVNLSVWFALHVLFTRQDVWRWGPVQLDLPVPDSVDFVSAGLAVAAVLAILRFKQGMLRVLAACAGLGIMARLLLGVGG